MILPSLNYLGLQMLLSHDQIVKAMNLSAGHLNAILQADTTRTAPLLKFALFQGATDDGVYVYGATYFNEKKGKDVTVSVYVRYIQSRVHREPPILTASCII